MKKFVITVVGYSLCIITHLLVGLIGGAIVNHVIEWMNDKLDVID